MKKIFLPCKKAEREAIGLWNNSDGKTYKDFIRFEYAEKLTDKILKSYLVDYKQEAIFYESINNKTKKYNSGTCYYSKTKKDVFKIRRTRHLFGIHETIKFIKTLIKNGVSCYTIEKHGKNQFIVYTWKKESNRKIRLLKRVKLIKKLSNRLYDLTTKSDIPLNISIKNGISRTNSYSKILQNKIRITPDNIKYIRIKNGYNDGYYIGRKNKIDKYILNNYKKALRFVILHEIGHLYFYQKYYNRQKFASWHNRKNIVEKFCDCFAIRHLKTAV